VYDGKMHPVDSNDISFKIAGIMAFKEAFQKADPQVLEPIYTVEVLCPEELTGAVMGDLQSRRGMVEGIDTEGHFQKVLAKVPLSEMHDFSSSLRSITQGRAKFKMHFESYQPVSYELQRKLSEEYNKSAEEAVA
jgi:elongation factor G